MKNCKTCGQALPKQTPQTGDIVQIEGLTPEPRLGVVLDKLTDDIYCARFGKPMLGYIRVMAINGNLAGIVTQYAVSRLTVVKGSFRVTERL